MCDRMKKDLDHVQHDDENEYKKGIASEKTMYVCVCEMHVRHIIPFLTNK